jgi:hypothetical protein
MRDRRADVEISDHRQHRLLRTRRERPRYRPAKKREELAPFELIELHCQ